MSSLLAALPTLSPHFDPPLPIPRCYSWLATRKEPPRVTKNTKAHCQCHFHSNVLQGTNLLSTDWIQTTVTISKLLGRSSYFQ
jgi:hypothetical protein